MGNRDTLVRILDYARWAPSGDNTQPWKFEIISDDQLLVHGSDTRDWCLYDFSGHASHIAHGALLETIRIAATKFGLGAMWALREGSPDTAPVYEVRLTEALGVAVDPLFPFIETRTVQRRPMRITPLTEAQHSALREAVGAAYNVQFFESFKDRFHVARLLWANAHIRLTCPEAYRVHRKIIEWGVRFSADRIPEQAVGVDAATAKLMRWVMQSWERVDFFNRYLLGTIAPRIQLDGVPALACSAHLLLKPTEVLVDLEAYVRAGVAMQRLWLTATSLGLQLQPEMTPVIFRWYVRSGTQISARGEINSAAIRLASRFESLAQEAEQKPFAFFCRIGRSKQPESRSVRKKLEDLMVVS